VTSGPPPPFPPKFSRDFGKERRGNSRWPSPINYSAPVRWNRDIPRRWNEGYHTLQLIIVRAGEIDGVQRVLEGNQKPRYMEKEPKRVLGGEFRYSSTDRAPSNFLMDYTFTKFS